MRRRGVCARGGTTGVIRNAELGRGDARVSGGEVLLMRFALGSRLLLRFCRGALPSVCARPCDSVGAFCLGLRAALRLCRGVLPRFARGLAALSRHLALVHACCLPHCAKQDGLRYLAFLFRRVEIAICAFSQRRCGYLPWLVHFGFSRFFMALSTGYRGAGNGDGGAAFVRLCASTLALLFFPRGVRWGSAPQTCAKESSTLWTLLF